MKLTFAGVTSLLAANVHADNPWDKYNFSPKTRSLEPVRIHSTSEGCTGGVVGEWNGHAGVGPAPQLDVQCAGGGTFTKVDFASFGNPSGSCGSFARGSCDAAGVAEMVEQLCLGQSRCLLPPSAEIVDGDSPLKKLFGDPCYGQSKQLAVQLSGCTSTHRATQTGSLGDMFPVKLEGKGASVVFDFGKEVGGLTTISFGDVGDGASAQLAWSESTYYLATGDDSHGGSGHDGTLPTGTLHSNTDWVTPAAKLRGGFRYLNIILDTETSVTINGVSLHWTAAPTMSDPSAYANHFYSDDDLVNRVWYGAAYTVQMNTIDPKQGRVWGPPSTGWDNSATCGVGNSVLVDGAKRDRVIWPGDMGVSTATAYYTTGDTYSSIQSLETLYNMQQSDGMMPYAGPPVNFLGKSDMYHLWALAGTCNLFVYTGDTAWLAKRWEGFKRAVTCSRGKVSNKGLMSVDKGADWQRCCQGGENIAANSLLAHVLRSGVELAKSAGDEAVASEWTAAADAVVAAINEHLWDAAKGAYKDNPTSSLYPQDGNSLAVWFGIANAAQAASISDYLHGNWGEFGSGSPEWSMNVGTFPGSMEVNAHAAMGNTQRALDMVRLQWGYMINSPNSTESTFWEGYNKDGTFNFKGIYMSNAHGWATGAAPMLSEYVLGLKPLNAGGARYSVAPSPGDLKRCEGRLQLGAGNAVAVTWEHQAGVQFSLKVDASAHPDGIGHVAVPISLLGPAATIAVDGHQAWPQASGTSIGSLEASATTASADGRFVHFVVRGGAAPHFVASASTALIV